MATASKTPRLLAAAKEFNIGKETLLEYLSGQGFEVVNNPNTKLTPEMYDALQAEFAQDRAAKKKSEQIDLPKVSGHDSVKTIDKEELRKVEPLEPLPSEINVETTTPNPAEVEEQPVDKAPEPTPEDTTTPEPEKTETPVAPPVATTDETEKPEEEKTETTGQTEETETPPTTKTGHLNVLGKINLDEINQSTRPKKSTKKKETGTKTTDTKAKGKAEKKPVPPATETPAPKTQGTKPEETKLEHIQTNSPKLTGPKILGKIELPKPTPTKSADSKEKRKRKRIPIDKKPEHLRNNDGRSRNNRSGNDRRGGYKGNHANQTPQEIDEKAIQKKIQETQAKLAGNTRGKGKAKYRRDKRDLMAEKRAAAEETNQDSTIQVTEFISVSELANLLNVGFADVISKCMGLGIMVSINQRLDAEVIELVANEFGFEVDFINFEEAEEEEVVEIDNEEDLEPRAPIVTIMGHVDHGKTSLLDYIREANVVAGEAGGITQHIGAYRVTTSTGKNLTFLDTPGHEAFTAMRARGAKVADVAVIVVAADDAIMPQTKEAISHAQAANLPMVFAINKIDKEGANPEKIKEQLSAMNILVEDWGGKYQSQEISAKQGRNIDELLEKILLETELLDLKANPKKEASGSVIEASLDKGRGYVATILVQNGELSLGDMIVCGQHYGKIKAMFNERGQRVKKAASTPVQILGLNGAPQAGEKFKVFADENEAKSIANHRSQILREQGIRARKHLTLDEIGRRLALGNFQELPIIIKGDFDGSVEALSDSLQKLSTEEVAVNVVHKGVGQITESDVNLATASDAIILGFQVRPSLQASKLAEQENIEIRTYSIIYDAIEEVKSAMEGLLEPKVEKRTVCHVEVREVFKISGVGTIAGCYVLDGKISRNTKITLVREGIVLHTGELASLKRFKDDVKEVNAGYECGLNVKNFNDIKVGDVIEGFEEVEVKRTL